MSAGGDREFIDYLQSKERKEQAMKCPLRTKVVGVWGPIEEYDFGGCIEKECAWWDKLSESCCLHRIMVSLEALAGEAGTIRDKMPHEEQFRR